MSFLHYFSKDQDKRAKYIFNTVAKIYSKFDKGLQNGFEHSIKILNKELNIADKMILDIGSGTGAWSSKFIEKGARSVHGVDFSEKMVSLASKNHPDIKFSLENGEDLKEIKDNTYDLVTASFVLHGFSEDKRLKVLKEMKRVTKKNIVIQDFMGKTPVVIRILEFFERSDYKWFKRNFCKEMRRVYPKTKKISVKYGTGLYIAEK